MAANGLVSGEGGGGAGGFVSGIRLAARIAMGERVMTGVSFGIELLGGRRGVWVKCMRDESSKPV